MLMIIEEIGEIRKLCLDRVKTEMIIGVTMRMAVKEISGSKSRSRFQKGDRRFNDREYQFRNGGQKDDFSRGDHRNRGSSMNFSRGDSSQRGRLMMFKGVCDLQSDQTQSANEIPIKLSAICMSSVQLPYVPILLNETFTKERQDNPFCINCQEYGHTACYTKCPQFPKPKKGSPLPKIQKLNQYKCKEGVTFANVVSGTNFPPLPTPNATVIKPRENKNSSKEIHGIHQEDKSDLAQVIELVNLISNILKRSPEILQILNNLKNADDDNAKTFLLVEALLDKK
ncbi:uncharacterized protein TNCV_157271 [Trichonephila clavipes]|nr:uncharacterized protein TNCV_157271 [Trichonephila clavipes]